MKRKSQPQAPLDLPVQTCPLRLACLQAFGNAPERTPEEWLRLYPSCARQDNGTAAECPHIQHVTQWQEAHK